MRLQSPLSIYSDRIPLGAGGARDFFAGTIRGWPVIIFRLRSDADGTLWVTTGADSTYVSLGIVHEYQGKDYDMVIKTMLLQPYIKFNYLNGPIAQTGLQVDIYLSGWK